MLGADEQQCGQPELKAEKRAYLKPCLPDASDSSIRASYCVCTGTQSAADPTNNTVSSCVFLAEAVQPAAAFRSNFRRLPLVLTGTRQSFLCGIHQSLIAGSDTRCSRMQAMQGTAQVCATPTVHAWRMRREVTLTAHGCSCCCQVAKIQGAGSRKCALCVRAAAPSAPAPGGRRSTVQAGATPAVKAAVLAEAAELTPASTAFTPRPITSVLTLEGLSLPSYGGPLPGKYMSDNMKCRPPGSRAGACSECALG